MLKKIGKILGIITLGLLVLLLGAYLVLNEKMPEGTQSAEADALANKMLKAVKHEAYKNTRYLEWTFKGAHHYKWDKQEQLVEVTWDKNKVDLNIQQPEKSTVFADNVVVAGEAKAAMIEKAVAYFNNDSFWLVAPHKAFDSGTERRIVSQENGGDALLITYTSGGNTPGDSYLWFLDESGLPTSFKMWVNIIPLGGVEASWEDWKTTESGVLLPAKHSLQLFDLDMGEVKAWN